jgi:hypothetical protein
MMTMWEQRTRDQIKRHQEEAAMRIFAILTRWLSEHPECTYTTTFSDGLFTVTVQRPASKIAVRGQSVQDAYAQIAQTLALSGDLE